MDLGDILPSREATLKVLEDLADGTISREDAADWASSWMQQVETSRADVNDQIVWDAIENLTAADLKTTDRPYLLTSADFEAWYNTFKEQITEAESNQ